MKRKRSRWEILRKALAAYTVVNVGICFLYLYYETITGSNGQVDKSVFQRIKLNQNDLQMREINYTPFKSGHEKTLNETNPPLFDKVRKETRTICNGSFTSFNGIFAFIKNVIVDTNRSVPHKRGGENISEVLHQKEKEEFIKPKHGFFKLHCESKTGKTFHFQKGHLKDWENSLEISLNVLPSNVTENTTTIAIVRYDYANLYWVMVELYDIFFQATILGINPGELHILIIDAHPVSILDDIWSLLFSKVTRIGHIKRVIFKTLIWGMQLEKSPLFKNGNYKTFPFLEEFRYFVLSKIKSNELLTDSRNCTNLKVMIVFRRDYIAHPRNPTGRVTRKISNEQDLLSNVSAALQGHTVTGIQLDLYPMEEQIQLASQTDILVGMHGAGMSHVMFIPNHASFIELFPIYHNTVSHFEFIARWRKLKYFKWKNKDKKMEIDKYTTNVNVEQIVDIVGKSYKEICGGN